MCSGLIAECAHLLLPLLISAIAHSVTAAPTKYQICGEALTRAVRSVCRASNLKYCLRVAAEQRTFNDYYVEMYDHHPPYNNRSEWLPLHAEATLYSLDEIWSNSFNYELHSECCKQPCPVSAMLSQCCPQ